MKEHIAEKLTAVMDHIETHLQERLDLDTVAEAARYSKYHLHRMFPRRNRDHASRLHPAQEVNRSGKIVSIFPNPYHPSIFGGRL